MTSLSLVGSKLLTHEPEPSPGSRDMGDKGPDPAARFPLAV